jgi:hypothetical protein
MQTGRVSIYITTVEAVHTRGQVLLLNSCKRELFKQSLQLHRYQMKNPKRTLILFVENFIVGSITLITLLGLITIVESVLGRAAMIAGAFIALAVFAWLCALENKNP